MSLNGKKPLPEYQKPLLENQKNFSMHLVLMQAYLFMDSWGTKHNFFAAYHEHKHKILFYLWG